jgi:hypothetical protein
MRPRGAPTARSILARPQRQAQSALRTLRNGFRILTAAALAGAVSLSLSAHPGGLDANGGHNDRKNGGYHYHRTPPASAGAPTTQAKPEPAPKPESKTKESDGFWITTSSGVRHNAKCRYFKTSKGRPATKDEGRACKICGG